jgi:two-component system response regulator ChvI
MPETSSMVEQAVGATAVGGRILIVDDDTPFRESLAQSLACEGFQIKTAVDGEEALTKLFMEVKDSSDLVILDWKMPNMSGIEVLRRIRQARVETPVMFLTALTPRIYEESGLAAGAADFVEKSRGFRILLKRIDVILSRVRKPSATKTVTNEILISGSLELKLKSQRALWKNREIPLTLGEFNIVELIASRAGVDVHFRDIYNLVHEKSFAVGYGPDGYRGNVRTAIKRIRQKFRGIDNLFESIENHVGFGYRWRKP